MSHDAPSTDLGGPEDVEILDRTTRYQGFFRLTEIRLRHRLYAGGWTAPFTRELFDRGHAVVVLLFDPMRDAVVLVEQFRVGTLNGGGPHWLLEAVAGIVEDGESPEDVARREAVEEAGCTIRRIERVATYFPSPGGCSETITLFCGEVDSTGVGGVHGLADEHEDIRVVVMDADKAVALLDRDVLLNGAIIIALGWLARHRDRLRREWA